MNGERFQMDPSGDEISDGTASQSPTLSSARSKIPAFDAAFDAAFLRLQIEADQKPYVNAPRCGNSDPRAPLVALFYAAAEKIIILIVEADRTWHKISNAISGQTWGESNREASRAISRLRRNFKAKPFSKIESRMETSFKCLVSALEEEPKQQVTWYEADSGAPDLEEECEMDSERLTVLMDAATDRLRIIRWDLETMQNELARNVEASHINDRAGNRQLETSRQG